MEVVVKVRKIIEEEWSFVVQKIGESGYCKSFWDPHGYLKVSTNLKETIYFPNFLHLVMVDKSHHLLGVFHGEIYNSTLNCLEMIILESNTLRKIDLKISFCEKIHSFAHRANREHADIDYIRNVRVHF